MSIRTTKAKKATKEETADVTSARPDSIHNAILFLLAQAKMNNRDITREADRHARILLDELDNKKPSKASVELPAPEPIPAADATAPAPSTDAAPSTAELLRPSRRFKRTSS